MYIITTTQLMSLYVESSEGGIQFCYSVLLLTVPSCFSSPEVKNLLDGLLAPNEGDRLGAQERFGMQAVQGHAWFNGVDWDELSAGNMEVRVAPDSVDRFGIAERNDVHILTNFCFPL